MTRGGLDGEDGIATLTFPVLVWLTVVAGVTLVDVGAYLVAAARAQQLADAGALAAVAVDVPPGGGDPVAAAHGVVTAGGGRLDACACRRGGEEAGVTVSVAVPGLVVPRLLARRVEARADAVLADAWARASDGPPPRSRLHSSSATPGRAGKPGAGPQLHGPALVGPPGAA